MSIYNWASRHRNLDLAFSLVPTSESLRKHESCADPYLIINAVLAVADGIRILRMENMSPFDGDPSNVPELGDQIILTADIRADDPHYHDSLRQEWKRQRWSTFQDLFGGSHEIEEKVFCEGMLDRGYIVSTEWEGMGEDQELRAVILDLVSSPAKLFPSDPRPGVGDVIRGMFGR